MSPGPSSDEIQSGSRGVRGAEVPARSVSRYRGPPTRVTRPPAARYREAPAVVSASRARGFEDRFSASTRPPTARYRGPPRVVSASRARGLRGPPRPGARSTCRALSRGATAAPGSPERRGVWGALSRPPISMARHGSVVPIRGLSRTASSRRPLPPPRALEGRHGCAGSPERRGVWGALSRPPSSNGRALRVRESAATTAV
jgi:hypothetical protein